MQECTADKWQYVCVWKRGRGLATCGLGKRYMAALMASLMTATEKFEADVGSKPFQLQDKRIKGF